MLRRLVIAAAVVTALSLPAAASAAVTCSFAGGTVGIDATDDSFFITVTRGTGAQADEIIVTDETAAPVACSSPTVTTADTIAFDSTGTTGTTTLFLDLVNGPLAPGATDEAGASDEIELTFTGNPTETDQLSIGGDGTANNLRFGATAAGSGANLNGAESDGVDVDVDGSSINRVFGDGGDGGDTITGDGTGAGGGFTAPVPFDVTLLGGAGNDQLASGNGGNNLLDGDADDDTLTGGPNADSLDVDQGNDTADGAGGEDFASYLNHGQPVTVDLGITGPQDTGGAGTDTLSNLESAVGGNAADTITGTAAPNTLVGGQLANDLGDDTLIGLGGADTLSGAPGNDVLVGGPGDDNLTGHAGTDTASYATGSTAAVSVSLDLALSGTPQNTGGAGSDTFSDSGQDPDTDHDIEGLIGSPFAGDTLTGNLTANRIVAYGDGLADTVDCVATGDDDTAVLDEVGVETVSNCETVDNAPQTSVASGPANAAVTNDSTPVYELTADEPSSFQVAVDGGAFATCPASCAVASLADGSHTLRFRAVDDDENQNADASPVVRTLTVDTQVPSISIDSAPAASSNDATPSWSFSSGDSSATFECRVDSGAFGPCSGAGIHTASVADGQHTFDVRATDAAGNSATAADGFAVDTAAPETTLGKVKKKTTKRRVKLSFNSSDASASFECSLDGKPFAACTSPLKTKKLKPGKHRFAVRSADALGNLDATPATAKFRVIKPG